MSARRALTGLFVAVAVAMVAYSCSQGPKVIPRKDMEKIYREMFIADQWLSDSPSKRPIADTTWFYAPIFEKYGYDVEDYRASVNYYLSDPKRYAEMVGRVAESLDNEASAINRDIRQQEKIRHRADSIAAAIKAHKPEDIKLYDDIFYVNTMTDRVEFRKNKRGVYFLEPVAGDTVFRGPELLIRDSSAVSDVKEETPQKEKVLVWRD